MKKGYILILAVFIAIFNLRCSKDSIQESNFKIDPDTNYFVKSYIKNQ